MTKVFSKRISNAVINTRVTLAKWVPQSVFYLLLVILSATFNTVSAQTLDFKRISVSDGLPHAQIYALLESTDGYMWIGTGGGLVKYDGVDFLTYSEDDGLKDDLIETIYEDSYKNIWVSTYGGGVATFQADSLVYQFEDSLGDLTVSAISQTHDGRYWFGTLGGGLFVSEGDSINQISTIEGLSSDWVWDIWQESDDRIWIATHNGVSIYDGTSLSILTEEDGLSDNRVYKITRSTDGTIWMATGNGLTRIDGNDVVSITEVDGLELNYVFDVDTRNDGSVWISTEMNGIYIFENDSYRHITKENGLSSNYIYTSFIDRKQNVWVGTYDYGLNLYRGDGFTFLKAYNGLQSDEVLGLFRDRNNTYWIGTSRGLSSYDGAELTNYQIPNSISGYDQVWFIDQLENGHMLVVLEDSSILEFDGINFLNYSMLNNLEELYIYDILVDSSGDVWLAVENGLVHINEEGTHTYTIDDGLSDNVVWHLYEDRQGKIWAGTYNGLSVFDGIEFVSYRTEEGLGHQNVNSIVQDERGDYWIGTGGGITYYRPDENNGAGSFIHFDKNDGLELLQTLALWFDNRGFLWQGTTGGIQRINVNAYLETGELIVTHYKLLNTGVGIETSHNALIEDEYGRGWFGSMNGVVIIDPLKVPSMFPTPEVRINDITLDSQATEWSEYTTDIVFKNGVVIPPSVQFPSSIKTYTFSFGAMEFLNPDNVRFRYRLSGFDDNWRQISSARNIPYTNIGSGDYSFEVQGRIGNSQWSESAIYPFSVNKPFWETLWFYGLVALILFSGGFMYVQYRLSRLEKSRLQILVEEQTREIRDALTEKEVLLKEVHHRVKNNLAIISSLLELQMSQMEDGPGKNELQEGSFRIRSISLIHEKLYQHDKLSQISIVSYVKSLTDSILNSIKNNSLPVDVNFDLDDIHVSVDDGIPFGLIINELITNVFYHAFDGRPEGEMNIKVRERQGRIELTVSDNGVGLPENFVIGQTDSLGLVLIDTLTQQLKGELTFKSGDSGTTFTIRFTRREERYSA